MIRLAFMGFRHGHINSVYRYALESNGQFVVAAACEEDARARAEIEAGGMVKITHDSYPAMLDQVECDAVAVGDYYTRRGQIVIEALRRGKHVISDKPICASIQELDIIARESEKSGLSVCCQLDLRYSGVFMRMREMLRRGDAGEVLSVNIGGQHPLRLGERPGWYFEPGKHGGTINDIGIHAFDAVPWLTGHRITEITAARTWNALAKDFPHFHDGAQFMLELENGCGVLGDMSYFMPVGQAASIRHYWRVTVFGSAAVLETTAGSESVSIAGKDDKEMRSVPALAPETMGYMKAFAAEAAGEKDGLSLTTREVLASSRAALLAQAAADENAAHVRV